MLREHLQVPDEAYNTIPARGFCRWLLLLLRLFPNSSLDLLEDEEYTKLMAPIRGSHQENSPRGGGPPWPTQGQAYTYDRTIWKFPETQSPSSPAPPARPSVTNSKCDGPPVVGMQIEKQGQWLLFASWPLRMLPEERMPDRGYDVTLELQRYGWVLNDVVGGISIQPGDGQRMWGQ